MRIPYVYALDIYTTHGKRGLAMGMPGTKDAGIHFDADSVRLRHIESEPPTLSKDVHRLTIPLTKVQGLAIALQLRHGLSIDKEHLKEAMVKKVDPCDTLVAQVVERACAKDQSESDS